MRTAAQRLRRGIALPMKIDVAEVTAIGWRCKP